MPVGNIDVTRAAQGNIVLRDLIALYEVGVKIVFAVEFGKCIYGAAECMPCLNAELHVFAVYGRKSPGKPQTARAHAPLFWLKAGSVFRSL